MATRIERLNFILSASEAKLVAGIKKAAAAFTGLERSSTKSTTKLERSFDRLDRKIDGVAQSIKRRVLSVQTVIAGLATGAGAAAPIKFAQDFEKALANVDTLLVDATVAIEQYEQQLLNLASASSKELIDLTQGLYQTISAGIPAVEGAGGAFDVLEKAQRAAVAGLSTTEEAVNAFTTILNAYKDSALDVTEVSDLLFTTVRRGKTTFPEIAAGIGRVATVGAKAGVQLDELLAALASLTKAGLSTNEAVTAIRSTILGILKPTDRARKLFKELGIPIGENALKGGGLASVLGNISSATGDSADAIVELIPNVRALVGALALGTDGAKTLREDLDAMQNSVGATDAAYEKIAKTFDNTAAILKSQLQAALITAGDRVLPRVQDALERLGDFVVANQERIANAFEEFIDLLFSVGQFIIENGDRILGFFAAFFAASKIAAATKALQGFAAAMAAAVTAANAGAVAGGAFLTGFQKAVRAIPALLAGILRSPSALGLIAGAGVIIGTLIADIIGSETEAALARAKENAERARKEAEARARGRGFASREQEEEERQALIRGERVQLGEFSRENVLPQDAALERLIEEGRSYEQAAEELRKEARQEVQRIGVRAKVAEQTIKDAAEREERARDQLSRVEDKSSAEAEKLRQTASKAAQLVIDLRAEQAKLVAAGRRVLDLTESAIEDREFAAADADLEERRAKAAADRAKAIADALRAGEEDARQRERAERARLQLLAAVGDLERENAEAIRGADAEQLQTARSQIETILAANRIALAQRLTDERLAFDARQQFEEVTAEERLQFERRIADAKSDLAIEESDARLDLLDREQQAIERGADAQLAILRDTAQASIEEAKAAGEALKSQYQEGADEREQIEEAVARQILLIRERLAADTVRAELEAQRELAEKQREQAEEEARRAAEEREKARREADEAARQQQAGFASRLVEFARKLGELLDEAVDAFADGLVEAVIAAGRFIEDAIVSPILDAVAIPLRALTGALGGAVGALVDDDPETKAAAELAQTLRNGVVQAERLARSLPGLVDDLVDGLREAIPRIIPLLVDALDGALRALLSGASDLLTTVINSVIDALPQLSALVADAVPVLIDALAAAAIEVFRRLPDIAASLGTLSVVIERAFIAISNQLAPLVLNLVSGAVQALTTLVQRLPQFISSIVFGLTNLVAGLVAAIPELLDALIAQLPEIIVALVELLPSLVANLTEAVIRSIPRILRAVFAELLPGLIRAAALLVIEVLPRIVAGLIEALVDGLGGLVDRVFEFFRSDFLEALLDGVKAIAVALGEAIIDAFKSIAEGIAGEGGFFDALFGGSPDGFGGEAGAFIGRTTGLSGLGKIVRGDFDQLGVEDIPIIGGIAGLFHRGGMIPDRMRKPATAYAMRLAGAPAFQAGGMVNRLNTALRAQLGASMADDVPAVLQAGEGVLSRVGVAAAGGAQAVAEMNRGSAPSGPQMLQPVLVARDDAGEQLLRMLVDRVEMEAVTPGSGLNAALNSDPFSGISMVRGRRTF